jgi:hypothetical protein
LGGLEPVFRARRKRVIEKLRSEGRAMLAVVVAEKNKVMAG